jgi:adenylate cyclase
MLVTTRLVDRSSGRQIWAEEFETGPGMDRPTVHPQDVARIIAARVGAEQGVVAQTLLGERGHLSYDGLYGAILRSYNFFFAREVRELAPTLGALRRGVADEPENALAWTQLGRLIQVNHVFELTEQRTPLDEAIACGYQAVRLDPSLTRARCVLAASLLAQGELEAGRNELEQALRLNPRSLVYLEIVGWLLALLGDWERGIALGREAMARNPHHLPHVYMGLWADHLRRGELEEAHKAALEYRDSAFFWRSLMRTSSLGLLGRREEARASAAVLMREKPTFKERGRVLIGHYLKAASLQERVIEGLRHAGLALR